MSTMLTPLARAVIRAFEQTDERGATQNACPMDAGRELLAELFDAMLIDGAADSLSFLADDAGYRMEGDDSGRILASKAVEIALDAIGDNQLARVSHDGAGNLIVHLVRPARELGQAVTYARKHAHTAKPDPVKAFTDHMLTISQLRNLPPPQSLVEDFLDLDSVAFGYGPRGCYKSFAVVDLGMCIATGTRWHGRMVTHGPVLYVVGEGIGGLTQRFDAWLSGHPLANVPENFHVFPEPINLLASERVSLFADAAASIGARFVILDTLARCLVGGDENSAKDAGLAVQQLDVIRRKTGACVYVVHHAGKNAEAGARGSSAFEASADTVHAYEGSDGLLTVRCTKQKNHPQHLPVHLRTVAAGESLYLELNRGGLPDEVTSKEFEALAALDAVAGPDGASHGDWKASAGDRKVSEGKFAAARKALIERDFVTALDGRGGYKRYHLTAEGSALLAERGELL